MANLLLKRNHPEVKEPGLAPGQDKGEQHQHHVIRDHIVPVVLKHLGEETTQFLLLLHLGKHILRVAEPPHFGRSGSGSFFLRAAPAPAPGKKRLRLRGVGKKNFFCTHSLLSYLT